MRGPYPHQTGRCQSIRLGMRPLLALMLCGPCTCLPCLYCWMPPHSRPSRGLTSALRRAVYTPYRWSARPQRLLRPGPPLVQPLSARCMRALLRFRMSAHSLPFVLGGRPGAPRAQRLCQRCDQHALGDERHRVFECPALQCVCETSMLHCLRMGLGLCNSSCGWWTSLVLRKLSWTALTCWMCHFDPFL